MVDVDGEVGPVPFSCGLSGTLGGWRRSTEDIEDTEEVLRDRGRERYSRRGVTEASEPGDCGGGLEPMMDGKLLSNCECMLDNAYGC